MTAFRLVFAVALSLVCVHPAAAQVPDLSGIYAPVRTVGTVDFTNPLPYRPDAAEKAHTMTVDQDPSLRCLPDGSVRHIVSGTDWIEIVQAATKIYLFFNQRFPRQVVHLDQVEHPSGVEPAFYGHSIGRFNGETLEVDVVGEDARTLLETPRAGRELAIHSDGLHAIYRLTKIRAAAGDNLLKIDATVEDPKTFTQPISATAYFRELPPDAEQPEGICEEALRFE